MFCIIFLAYTGIRYPRVAHLRHTKGLEFQCISKIRFEFAIFFGKREILELVSLLCLRLKFICNLTINEKREEGWKILMLLVENWSNYKYYAFSPLGTMRNESATICQTEYWLAPLNSCECCDKMLFSLLKNILAFSKKEGICIIVIVIRKN